MRTGRLRSIAGIVCAGLVVAACSSGGSSTAPSGPEASISTIPEARTVLRVAAVDWPTCFEPLTCDEGALGDLILDHTLPGVFAVGEDGVYRPTALMAEPPTAVVEANGHQVISYRVAPAARWHDGRPVTSSDFHASWQAAIGTPGAAEPVDRLVLSVDDRDPFVAVVTLSRPSSDWRELFGGLHGWLLPSSSVVDSTDLTGAFATEPPIGAGPFEVVAVEDDLIVLDARRGHWNENRQPAIDQIRIERLAEDADDWPSLSRFDVVAVDPDDDRLLGRSDTSTFVPVSTLEPAVTSVFIDERTPVLQERVIRLVVSALAEESQLAALTEDGQPVSCPGWLLTDPACIEEPAEAVSDLPVLLDAVGFVSDGSGGRRRGNEVLAIPVSYDPTIPGADSIANALRFRLRNIGVDVTVVALARANFFDPARTDARGLGVFAAVTGTTAALTGLLRCQQEGGAANPIGVCDPDLSSALAALDVAVDSDDRLRAATEVSARVARIPGWLPVEQHERQWLVAMDRVAIPDVRRPGRGPLDRLDEWARIDQ